MKKKLVVLGMLFGLTFCMQPVFAAEAANVYLFLAWLSPAKALSKFSFVLLELKSVIINYHPFISFILYSMQFTKFYSIGQYSLKTQKNFRK